jgi:hypothetical protein
MDDVKRLDKKIRVILGKNTALSERSEERVRHSYCHGSQQEQVADG